MKEQIFSFSATRDRLLSGGVPRLLGYLPPYRAKIACAVAAMLVTAGTSSLIALLLGKLTDIGFYEKDPHIIFWAPVALIGISVIHGFGTFSSTYLLQVASQGVLVRIRGQMFESMISWPASTYQRYTSGGVMSKFVNEASNALGTAAEMLTTIVRDSLQVAALSCVLLYHNWKLTLVTLVVAPALALILRWVSRRVRKYTTGFQNSLGEMTSVIQEAYEGQRIIKVYDGFAQERSLFGAVNNRIRVLSLKLRAVKAAGTPLSQFVSMSAVSVVVVVALAQAQAGIITMGEFVTFLSALLLMMPPIRHLSNLNGSLATLSAACESVFTMMDEPAEKETGTVELPRVRGDVRFENVTYSYEGAGTVAVKDFTLEAKAGEVVALVGSSGAGKTTMINLIARFWRPDSGEIYFDGVPQSSVTLKSLRRQVALVSQDVILFNGTIAENIAYGSDAGRREVEEAARAAWLMPFVETLPRGLDTEVGEAGSKLSGGQKQRISIARAILKDAPILLLDEATSALDTESERHIQQSLDELMQGRTTFVVAHRLSTIEGADRIVVMHGGLIQEIGRHEELLERGGMYSRLYHLQFSQAAG